MRTRRAPTASICIQVGSAEAAAYLRVRVSFDPGTPRWQGSVDNCPSDVDWYGEPPTVEAIEEIEAVKELMVGNEVIDGADPLVVAAVERELLPLARQQDLDVALNEELKRQADIDYWGRR